MICVSLAKMSFRRLQQALRKVAMAEIRLDDMALSQAEIAKIFAMPLPLVATCRPGRYPEPERREMLATAMVNGAAYMDIEMEADPAYRCSLIKLAREYHCRVIISYHNEKETPPKKRLNRMVETCLSQGAEIVKIACRVKQRRDMLRIIALYELAAAREGSLIALGMGAPGKLTRIAAPFFGAPFTYAAFSPGKETAAGQISFSRMAKMIACLGEA